MKSVVNRNLKKTDDKHPERDQLFDLWVLLQQTKDAVYNVRNKELSEYGISPREAAIFRAIGALGKDVTPTALARWVYRKPSTMVGILRRMQRKGLVKLTKDPYIRNVVRVSITSKGKQIQNMACKRESIHKIFSVIAKENLDQLESSLTEIRSAALEESRKTPNDSRY